MTDTPRTDVEAREHFLRMLSRYVENDAAYRRLVDEFTALTSEAADERLRAALDETQRMLEYLWSATGSRAPDLPVSALFNDDDPLIQDVPTCLGKARMVLHGQALANSEPKP